VVPVTRRTKVIGFGTVLVLVGLVLIFNFGLASLAHSPVFREHNLTDPFTIEVSSRAVVTDDVELLRWNTMPDFVSPSDDVRVEGVAAGSGTLFMGIAPADAVAGYLDGVAHDRDHRVGLQAGRHRVRRVHQERGHHRSCRSGDRGVLGGVGEWQW
jgi:hypothetical protein